MQSKKFVYSHKNDIYSKVTFATEELAFSAGVACGYLSFYVGELVESVTTDNDASSITGSFRKDIINQTDKYLADKGLAVRGYEVQNVRYFNSGESYSHNKRFHEWS